jgi:hypothetical protein
MIREASALIGVVAFMLMAYRVVSTWDDEDSDWLVRALAGGVMALLLVGSIGSAIYAINEIQGIDWVQWLILGSRVVAVLVALSWPNLVGQKGIPVLRHRPRETPPNHS